MTQLGKFDIFGLEIFASHSQALSSRIAVRKDDKILCGFR